MIFLDLKHPVDKALTALFAGPFIAFFPTPAVQSLNSLNDQIASFMVTGPAPLEEKEEVRTFCPPEKETLQKSMTLMRHLLVDAQVRETLFSATAACWCHIFILRVRTQNTSLFILFSCLSSQIVVQTSPSWPTENHTYFQPFPPLLYDRATICRADQVKHLQIAASNGAIDLVI